MDHEPSVRSGSRSRRSGKDTGVAATRSRPKAGATKASSVAPPASTRSTQRRSAKPSPRQQASNARTAVVVPKRGKIQIVRGRRRLVRSTADDFVLMDGAVLEVWNCNVTGHISGQGSVEAVNAELGTITIDGDLRVDGKVRVTGQTTMNDLLFGGLLERIQEKK